MGPGAGEVCTPRRSDLKSCDKYLSHTDRSPSPRTLARPLEGEAGLTGWSISLMARPPCGGSDFQRSGGVMTLTGCRIRFDCPVGPAGVVIEIPCSGAKFFLFYGLHRSV